MANPSSSHRERERERERHHHHRTISSTTLLLVLSLILAVLAVMLSLPSNRHIAAPPNSTPETAASENASAFWSYLTPKRSEALVAREHEVALREAEVAKREAELLAGSAGGYAQPTTSSMTSCMPYSTMTPGTVVTEVVHSIGGPRPPVELRMEDVMHREERISDREKEVGKREETVGKRETDASRRENWIMEQLIALGNDPSPMTVETEDFMYDPTKNRKVLPEPVPTHTQTLTRTVTESPTETVVLHPAQTRLAARPLPEEFVRSNKFSPGSAPTTAVEVTQDHHTDDDDSVQPSTIQHTVTVVERPRQTRMPRRSFWNW